MAETYRKIDENTVEITTTTEPIETKVKRDKAELQTELDHIPDRLSEAQEQIDAVNERKDELVEILKVFD